MDPIEEEGGLNLYGFVRNCGPNCIDQDGCEVVTECPINSHLKTIKFTEDPDFEGGFHRYYGGNPDFDQEILKVMIRSEHRFAFYGSTTEACWDKITKYISMRKDIIKRARILQNLQYGVKETYDKDVDPFKNPEKVTIGCAKAAVLAFKGPEHFHGKAIRSAYFIPGDLGYIANAKSALYGGPNGNNGEEGENIIYLGNGQFFGHNSGKPKDKLKSLKSWEGYIDRWKPGEHDTWDYRYILSDGLDGFDPVNPPGLWPYEDTNNPYGGPNGAKKGQWLPVKWPTN